MCKQQRRSALVQLLSITSLGFIRLWLHIQGAAKGMGQIQSLSMGTPGKAGVGSLRAGRPQSLPQPQIPKLLPCSSHTPPASKCLLTLLGNLFSPRLTCTVSSAYGSDKLIKCAEHTKRSLFPSSAPAASSSKPALPRPRPRKSLLPLTLQQSAVFARPKSTENLQGFLWY